MVDFTDLHYAQMLSGRLENFRIRSTNPYKINFRCPICGDSQKSRSKSRGWLLEKDNNFFYYCHNCGESQTFQYFMKGIDNLLYNDYVAEKFIKKDTKKEEPDFKTVNTADRLSTTKKSIKDLKKVSQLNHDHPLKRYIQQRKIPAHQHYRLYFAKKFKTWINGIIPNKFENIDKDEPRLVIPFFDEKGNMFGVSARGFNPNGIRYITIMFEDRPKIFGLDKVDFKKQFYIVEGAIDSMFLNNSVAMAGAEGNTNGLNMDNAVFVFDAEPRNKEIHKRMEKVIEQGHKIVIWPNDLPGKDINEMILNGINNIEDILNNNIHKGLEAKLQLAKWRKT